jgi:hypothetical protein
MTTFTRITLLFTLFLSLAAGKARAQESSASTTAAPSRTAKAAPAGTTVTSTAAAGQEGAATATSSDTATTQTSTADEPQQPMARDELREQFNRVLRRHPPQVGMILAMDPTLLSDEPFMSRYPVIAEYVKQHPEVRHTPSFYLANYEERPVQLSVFEQVIQPIIIMAGLALFLFAFAWVVRTYIEQQRWSRMARTQTEVHNKILDRFGTTAELLDYVRTSAGTKFLESAPIPLHESPRTPQAPFTRVIRSVQIGVIVAAGALGVLITSTRFSAAEGGPLFALGMIALSIGLGFIASAAVSIFLSKRLGLLQANGDDALTAAEQ